MQTIGTLLILTISLVSFILGIKTYRGNTRIINAYHMTYVKDSDKSAYSKAIARGLFVLSAFIGLGALAFYIEKFYIFFILLIIGLAIDITLIVRAQKKYNSRII